jgi:hypothetical protein
MSAKELLDRLMSFNVGDTLNWREMRDEIHAEHKKAPDERDRILCLDLHRALMDFAERRAIEPHEIEKFRETRYQDYALLLFREAMIGQADDNLDPVEMLAITSREVRAGRMSKDDKLYRLAVEGVQKIGPSPTKPSLGTKLRSWFK